MKKKFIYIIIAIVAIIIALIFLLRKPKIYMEKTFPETIEIINYTDYDVDTSLLTIADKILSLDTLTIRVIYTLRTIEVDDIIINNFAVKNSMPHDYSIFIGRGQSNSFVRKVLAHEMAHVEQYESGRLTQIKKKSMLYEGEEIDLTKTEYKDRKFEIDAFREQYTILSMLNRITYE